MPIPLIQAVRLLSSSGSFQRAANYRMLRHRVIVHIIAVTNAKMANMATQTFKGRNTAGSGAPEDINMTTARTMLSINNVDNTSDLEQTY